MIVVNILGGLGNQMFQIALCKSLELNGKKVLMDKAQLKTYLLDKDWDDASQIFDIDISISNISKIKRKLYKITGKKYIEKNFGDFDPDVLDLKNVYLDGYWQSYKYFDNIKNIITEMFKFSRPLSDGSKKFLKHIKCQKNSISLHIRLGDYLQGINKDIYGGICTEVYYEQAIKYFKDKYKECTFFVFSNDKKYIEKYRNMDEFVIVNCNDEKNAWEDMYLMTQCNHNIIANSSFSWWGAYLNCNIEKEVIAPTKWLNTNDARDICPSSWKRI